MDSEAFFQPNKRTMVMRKRPVFIILVAIVLVVLVLLISTIYLATHSWGSHDDNGGGMYHVVTMEDSGEPITVLPSPVGYFNVTDGLDVAWYPAANSEQDLVEAVSGKYHMLSGDVSTSSGSAKMGNSSLTLMSWVQRVLQSRRADGKSLGIKLNLLDNKAVTMAVDCLKKHRAELKGPVILSSAVLSVGSTHVDRQKFVQTVSNTLPEVSLGVSINMSCCSEPYGIGELEALWSVTQPLNQSAVFIDIRAGLVKQSWTTLRWLLNKSNKITMIISSGKDDMDGVSAFDLLFVRNDCDDKQLLYNMKGDHFQRFNTAAVTASSPMFHFNIVPREAGRIVWAHAVNNEEKLKEALKGDAMMLEADILLEGQGTPNQTDIPVMAHPPQIYSNLTFEAWSDAIIPSGKGMKLDFKSLEAVPITLEMLSNKSSTLKAPVWINADILKGPNGPDVIMNHSIFLESVKKFPNGFLSLGWTTVAKGNKSDVVYTTDMVQQMHGICKDLPQPVTFPVRAEIVRPSMDNLRWLLNQSRGYSLTVWTALTDSVTKDDMNYVRRHTEQSRVYFDLPAKWRPDIFDK